MKNQTQAKKGVRTRQASIRIKYTGFLNILLVTTDFITTNVVKIKNRVLSTIYTVQPCSSGFQPKKNEPTVLTDFEIAVTISALPRAFIP